MGQSTYFLFEHSPNRVTLDVDVDVAE